MAISIDDVRTDALARRLAALTGEEIADAVRVALEERLERQERRQPERRKASLERLKAIVEEYNRLPVVDAREPDEILGYDENGLPT
jgi:antitoxin VapB